jgi:hypothetical protein
MAYLNIGSPTPLLSYIDQPEWENILAGFKIEQGGGFKEWWALVTLKSEDLN